MRICRFCKKQEFVFGIKECPYQAGLNQGKCKGFPQEQRILSVKRGSTAIF